MTVDYQPGADEEDAPLAADPLDGDEPVEVAMPEEEDDLDEDEPSQDALAFCELCGASEHDDEELLRCEECGRMHCSVCREFDDDGSPYCADCYDDVSAR